MSDVGPHCPFLNRTDARCAGFLSLESLRHSYNYCFGNYAACQVYTQLLIERRVRRGETSLIHSPAAGMSLAGTLAGARLGSTGPGQLVQLSMGRMTIPASAASASSAVVAPAATATKKARGRWGLWRSVRRGIVAGLHLRLASSPDENEQSQSADLIALPSAPTRSIAPLATIAPPSGIRARAG
jgi:hypothetical protein